MKFIIEFDDLEVSPADACEYVKQIVSEGLVSNQGRQYCYVTVFVSGVTVGTYLNKKSHRFVLRKESQG